MGQIDVEAVSGIFGAISIAAWVVVFTPQIYQNFRNKSAEGLSLPFMLIWLVGDIFNIIGSITQHVLTSMIILAVYYTIADFVVLGQMFWYRGFRFRKSQESESEYDQKGSRLESAKDVITTEEQYNSDDEENLKKRPSPNKKSSTSPLAMKIAKNTAIVIGVCCAGIFGWLVQDRINGARDSSGGGESDFTFDTTGQLFGYLSAVTYTASRVPQLWMNWKRKTTEGLSMLFFTFAFIGNVSYIISILAYNPKCAQDTCQPGEINRIYHKYLLINLSWILGSAINLLEDFAIFVQHFMYRNRGYQLDETKPAETKKEKSTKEKKRKEKVKDHQCACYKEGRKDGLKSKNHYVVMVHGQRV